jgi:hypothetical protein
MSMGLSRSCYSIYRPLVSKSLQDTVHEVSLPRGITENCHSVLDIDMSSSMSTRHNETRRVS